MAFTDVRTLTEDQRSLAADRLKEQTLTGDLALPRLEFFNYDPCDEHEVLTPLCKRCGATFWRHQRTGIPYLYVSKRCLLSDPTGSGKTIIMAGVFAMMKETGELGTEAPARRAVVIAQAAAVQQWRDELARLVPSLRVATAVGTARQRLAKYVDDWDVMIISPETLRLREMRRNGSTTRHGDLEILEEFTPGTVVYDDVDAMRHDANKTFFAINRLCENADRVYGIHATPLQKKLDELYNFLVPLGGLGMFGSKDLFRHYFVRTETIYIDTGRDRFGRQATRQQKIDVGIKNAARLKAMIAPMVLRRTMEQIDDVEMPTLVPNTVWLDPSPAQKRRYEELRKGVLRQMRDGEEIITQAQAMTSFMRGWQICSGLATLDDETSGDSIKLDWLLDKLTGDMVSDKVVAFINFKPNISDMSSRLDAEHINHVVMWGAEAAPQERYERQQRFLHDPQCRVLLGTTTIERSLNLQSARHLVAVDTIINPARMTQIAGRIKRVGSRYQVCYFHQLLLRGTQEQYIPDILAREQALSDYVWSARSELFSSLSAQQLLGMISGDPALLAQTQVQPA